MREEGERIMRKRDEAKNRREIIHALSMIMQIGLSMMVCMSVSLLIGYGLDKLLVPMFYGNHDVYRDFGIASQYACIDRTVSPGQYKKGNTGRKTGWRRRRLVYGKS